MKPDQDRTETLMKQLDWIKADQNRLDHKPDQVGWNWTRPEQGGLFPEVLDCFWRTVNGRVKVRTVF